MQHFSGTFQILSREKENVHPPSSPSDSLLCSPVPVGCEGITVLPTYGLLSFSPHSALCVLHPRALSLELFCLHDCEWDVQWGHLPGFLPVAPVPPRPPREVEFCPGVSLGRVGCVQGPHVTCFRELAGMDVTGFFSSCLRDPSVFFRTLGFKACLAVPSSLIHWPSARPGASREDSAVGGMSTFGFCLLGAHGSLVGCVLGSSVLCCTSRPLFPTHGCARCNRRGDTVGRI